MRRVVGAGLVVAGFFTLAACSSSTEAAPARTPSVPPSSAPSASATPSPTAPVMPELAKERTAEGAQAFVQYWFTAVTYGYASGDFNNVRKISIATCKACNRILEKGENQYSSGGHFVGYEITVDWVTAPQPDDQGVEVSFGITETARTAVAADGETSIVGGAGATTLATFFLDWSSDHWLAYEIANSK